MSKSRPLVSVIIPMYNTAEVFGACIENLLSQSYSPLEVIMLDDASTDNTYTLMQQAEVQLGEKGIALKLYSASENGGVASMRNKGLDLATGEYIYSYDADDYMEPMLIERLVDEAERTQADLVTCDWFLRYEYQDRRMHQPSVSTGQELFQQLCYGMMKWNVWLFLVRRSLFEQLPKLRYTPRDNMGEDMLMTSVLALRADKVATCPEALYYYVKTNSGAQTANYREEHWQQVDRNLKKLTQHVETYYPEQAQLLNFLKLNLKLPLLISSNTEDYRRWSSWYPEANGYAMKNPYLPMRTKLLQQVASKGLWSVVRLYNRIVMQWLYTILYK